MAKKQLSNGLKAYLLDMGAWIVDDYINNRGGLSLRDTLKDEDEEGDLENAAKEIEQDYDGLTIAQIRDWYKNQNDYEDLLTIVIEDKASMDAQQRLEE